MTALGGHSAEHIAAVWLVAAAAGVVALGVLIVIYRRAAARRELEEAERVIEDAFREDAAR
jgi:NADH:ubiquinone oxidoreductase subunit K